MEREPGRAPGGCGRSAHPRPQGGQRPRSPGSAGWCWAAPRRRAWRRPGASARTMSTGSRTRRSRRSHRTSTWRPSPRYCQQESPALVIFSQAADTRLVAPRLAGRLGAGVVMNGLSTVGRSPRRRAGGHRLRLRRRHAGGLRALGSARRTWWRSRPTRWTPEPARGGPDAARVPIDLARPRRGRGAGPRDRAGPDGGSSPGGRRHHRVRWDADWAGPRTTS